MEILFKGRVLRALPGSQAMAAQRLLRQRGEKFSVKEDKMYIRSKRAKDIILSL